MSIRPRRTRLPTAFHGVVLRAEGDEDLVNAGVLVGDEGGGRVGVTYRAHHDPHLAPASASLSQEPVEDGEPLSGRLGAAADPVPPVTEAGNAGQGRVGVPTDEHRRAAGLARLGVQRAGGQ